MSRCKHLFFPGGPSESRDHRTSLLSICGAANLDYRSSVCLWWARFCSLNLRPPRFFFLYSGILFFVNFSLPLSFQLFFIRIEINYLTRSYFTRKWPLLFAENAGINSLSWSKLDIKNFVPPLSRGQLFFLGISITTAQSLKFFLNRVKNTLVSCFTAASFHLSHQRGVFLNFQRTF